MKKFRVPEPCPRCNSLETGVFCQEAMSVKSESKIRFSYAKRGLHVSFVNPNEMRFLKSMQVNAFCTTCGYRYRANMDTVVLEKHEIPNFLNSRGLSADKILYKKPGILSKLLISLKRKDKKR